MAAALTMGLAVGPLAVLPSSPAQASPAAAGSITVAPRVIPPAGSTVVVSGTAPAGTQVRVTLGSLSQELGAVGESGSFTSSPFDVSGEPRLLLPVSVTTHDETGELLSPAGMVDNRLFSTVSSLRVSPTSIPYGTTTQVLGRLARTDGQSALAGRSIALYEVRDDGTSVALARTVTRGDGSFLLTTVLATSGRMKAVYSGDTGQRAAASPLSARVTVAGASYPSDRPATLSAGAAASASPQGRALEERLSSSSDIDVFAFGVPRGGVHRLVLGRLPVDAVLELFDRGGHLIARSDRVGVQFEELVRYLPAGTFLVRVRSATEAASSSPYHLSFARLTGSVVLLSSRSRTEPTNDGTNLMITAELLNTTNRDQEPAVRLRCALPSGSTTARDEHWVGYAMRGYARRPLEIITRPCPSGTVLRLDVLQGTAAFGTRVPVSLTVSGARAIRWGRQYAFTTRNTTDRRSAAWWVHVVEHDTEGRITAFATEYQEPMAAHTSRTATLQVFSPLAPNSAQGVLGLF